MKTPPQLNHVPKFNPNISLVRRDTAKFVVPDQEPMVPSFGGNPSADPKHSQSGDSQHNLNPIEVTVILHL